MKRTTTYWLSRDDDGFANLWLERPWRDIDGLWWEDVCNSHVCDADGNQAQRPTDITGTLCGVRPGQCKKIRVTTTIQAEVVE